MSESHRTDPDLDEEQLTVRVPTTYNWEACRGWNSHIHDYQIRSTLRRRGVVSSTILNTFSRDPLSEPGPIHVYGNGNYEWGGRIVRYTPDVTEPQGWIVAPSARRLGFETPAGAPRPRRRQPSSWKLAMPRRRPRCGPPDQLVRRRRAVPLGALAAGV